MPSEDEHGGFEDIRNEVDGHPMVGLFGYAVPYWKRLTVGVGASLLTRIARLVPPLIVAAAIDLIVRSSGGSGLLVRFGLLPGGIIDAQAGQLAVLERLVAIAALAYVVRSVTRFVSRYLLESTAQKIQRDLRNDAYDHMQHLSMAFFANHQTGGMMSILNSDINRLERFLNTELRQIIRVVAIVGGIGAILYVQSPTLALIALAPVPIIGLASAGFLHRVEPRYRAIRETVARLSVRLENNLSGAPVIKSFNRYEFERDRVAAESERYHDEQVSAIRIRRAFFSSLRVLTGVVFVAVLYVGGRGVITDAPGAVSVGAFAGVFLYIRRLYSPMRRIGKTANKYQLAKSSAERVFGVLSHDPAIASPENGHVPERVDGRVTFDDVTFGYEDGEPVISNLSLDVDPGETIGLAGPTGAGKSTLLKLIPRFHDTDAGAVSVDGTDVREYDIQALRESIGIVEQNPYLFSGTVRENIAYGTTDALDTALEEGSTDEQVREAAMAAEAHEFITDLPEGYDTQIGERGVKLSGGQRQRIAIARALLNDPAIIVLDEATSDVDTETEERIQQSLARLTADRTAFVIAHRLSTIQDADRIVVVDDGTITERGTHADLLAADSAYAELWQSQSRGPAEIGLEADDD
ncbi:ABC transporter ATP-binding protein [Halococcus saccharolyticus]|uniref:ABC transporter ATP-binding protein n=1 Tax=Halococcus saccharolyticus DSM 5350 TaxID=1227455 RepID=M0M9R2_9EURY|nr:ABC transporter ATP-binding protein [Halococcus saccharolyticus]EMA42512.1 ABC transporter ATP-binding protein [Halococcus saccharolyticus DSM 5350]